jgi:hypothetical protein
MGSTSQQLSQLAGGGSLSPYMAYLLLCDIMFWVLASWFCICGFLKHLCFFFTSGFLPHFLVCFCSLFIPERIGLCQAVC